MYLAVVMDLFSRTVVGWAAGPSIARELVLDAVLMAVHRQRPRGTVIHSDQGTQYGSDAWRRFCRSNHLEPSMSRKGHCWDNAVAASFFSSLKKEQIKKQIYKNRTLALADLTAYIDTLAGSLLRPAGRQLFGRHRFQELFRERDLDGLELVAEADKHALAVTVLDLANTPVKPRPMLYVLPCVNRHADSSIAPRNVVALDRVRYPVQHSGPHCQEKATSPFSS